MDLFSDTYKTIKDSSSGFFKDRGSKFYAHAFPVKTEEEVKEHLKALRVQYHDARHHCYAYALGPDRSAYRINDDGEPSGTAGKPIHGQLLSYDLTDVLVVVIRYFGGTKLGIPGLINAYREATRDALNASIILEKTVNETLLLSYDYPLMDVVMRYCKEKNLTIIETQFELDCKVKLSVRLSKVQEVLEQLNSIYGLKTEVI